MELVGDGNGRGISSFSFEDSGKAFAEAGVPHASTMKAEQPAKGEEYLTPVYTIHGGRISTLLVLQFLLLFVCLETYVVLGSRETPRLGIMLICFSDYWGDSYTEGR